MPQVPVPASPAWLPFLLAVSANPPFWNGRDTRYASFRSRVWNRWPSSGPTPIFGSVRAYNRLVERMLDTGVLLDPGMLYFDARLSQRFPTVEIRVADVCLDVETAELVPGLSRALVETAQQCGRRRETDSAANSWTPVPRALCLPRSSARACWRTYRTRLDQGVKERGSATCCIAAWHMAAGPTGNAASIPGARTPSTSSWQPSRRPRAALPTRIQGPHRQRPDPSVEGWQEHQWPARVWIPAASAGGRAAGRGVISVPR